MQTIHKSTQVQTGANRCDVLSIPKSVILVKNGTVAPGGGDRAMLESNLSTPPAHRGELYRSSRDVSPCPDGVNAINSGGEAEGEGASPLPAPTSLVSYRHISTDDYQSRVYTALVGAGEAGKAVSYMTCGQEVYTLKCESCGYEHEVQYNCKLRFCFRCAGVKMSGYMKKYLPYVKSLDAGNVRCATLTIKNVEDLREGIQRIRDCFTKLRRWEYYKRRIDGGLYGLEAKPDDDGKWNIHLHFVYYGSWMLQKQLSADWLEITGDSMVVDIRRAGRPSDALRYVLKYITKGIHPEAPEWTGESLVEFVLALVGVRLVQAFGCFLGKVAERKPFDCPGCGYRLWRRLDSEGETVWSPLERMLWNFRNGRSP